MPGSIPPPTPRMQCRRIVTAVVVIALIIVAGIVYSWTVDTTQMLMAPKCPLYMLTGFKCPGCGTQRALHELVRLNLSGVWQYNRLLFVALPYLAILLYVEFLGGKWRSPRLAHAVYSYWGIMAVFFVIVIYWAVRNVLGF